MVHAFLLLLLFISCSLTTAQYSGAELLVYPERLVSVVAGSAGSLTCVAYGNPQPQVLWLKDGVPLQNESSLTIYNTYLEDANMSFVQSILEVCNFLSEQQGNYSCYTENSHGNDSFQFKITVLYEKVMLVSSPSNTVATTKEVLFMCNASGVPLPAISWYKDGSLLESNVSNITTTMLNNDTVTSVLYLTDLRLADAGLYSCNASDSVGGIDAREFTLTIQSEVELLVFPTNSTAVAGSSSSFTCAVAGIPLPQIVWSRNDNISMDMSEFTTESNFTNSSSHFSVSILTLCDVRLSDTNVYTCTASNGVSQKEASFTFNIYSPPTVQPISDLVIGEVKRDGEYSSVSINFSVEAVPPPHVIEWTYAPNNFADAEPIHGTLIFPKLQFSVDNTSVTLENVSLSDAGIFTLTATNEVGTANASVQLIVYAEPRLIDTGYSGNNYTENETMWFWCYAEGVPDPRIVWLHNELWVSKLSPRHDFYHTLINGTVNSTLVVNNVQQRDAGDYLCRVDPFNISIGRSFISEIFSVEVYPELIDYCQSQPCLNNGTCYRTTNGYNCSCKSGYKGINCQKEFTVYEAAVIVRNPNFTESPSLFATISVTCNVQGSPPPIITWFKDGEELPGQHNQTLVLEEVTLESRGRYHCMATNSDPNNRGIQSSRMSEVTILNIEGVVQYKANIESVSSGNRRKREIMMVDTEMIINEMASRLSGVEFPEYNATIYSVTGDPQSNATITTGDSDKPSVDIIITLLAPEGNAGLKNAVLKRLQEIAPEVPQEIMLRNISRFDGCEAEDTILEPLEPGGLSITLNWPESDLGEERFLPCPCGNLSAVPGRDDISNARANRECGGNFINGGKWRAPFVSPCNFSSTTRQLCRTFALINGRPEEAITTLDNITRNTDSIGSTEIGVTTYLLEALQNNVVTNNQTQNLTRGFLTVVDNILDAEPEEIQMSQEASNSSARILTVVERVSESIPLPENKSQVIIPLTSFAVAVTQVDLSQQFFGQIISTSLGGDSNNRNEPIDLNDINITRITNNSELAQAGQRTSLTIPRNVFERLGNSSSSGRITNSIFLNDVLFSRRNSSASAGLEVGGIIMAAALSNNVTVQNLNPPVRLTFQKNPSLENGTNTTCRFWDFLSDGGFGDWSSRGCILINETETIATCECDHLTNFAILLDPNPVSKPTSMKDQTGLFLSVLSYIGAIVSIICLMATIVTYLTSKKLRSSEAGQLLINLCLALLGLYIMYITSLHATKSKPVCAVAGGLLHYFMLASFLAMGAEAISLYTKLVMVLGVPPIIKNKYILKACLIVWILPFIVVVLSEAPNWKNYVMDYYCRPYGPAFYGGLMVPFLLIYIFNWVIFVSIFVSLLRKKALTGNSGATTRLKQNFIIAVTLSLLFGLGWGVGLTATTQIPIKGLSYFLQTVFVLVTGFQGLLIFIMHCVRSEECRNQWKKWLYIASLHKIHLYMKASTLTGQVTSDYGKGTSGKNTYNSYTLATQSQTLQRVLKKEMDSGIAPSHSDTLIDHNNAFTPTLDPSGEEKKIDLSSDDALQAEKPANPFLGNDSDNTMVVVNQNALTEEVEMDVTTREDVTKHNTAGEFVPGENESIISEFDTVWLPSSSKTSCSSLQGQPNEKRLSRQSGLADLMPNTRTSHTQLPGNTRTSHTQLPGNIRTSLSQLSGNARTSQTQLPGNCQNAAAYIEKAPLIEEQESSEGDNTSLEN